MRIGFDFDGIFVDKPPFIPQAIGEWLYKRKKNHTLIYRFPGRFEQKLRVFSHHSVFRSPLRDNVRAFLKMRKNRRHTFYLVSGRFGFLREKTHAWLTTHKMGHTFKKMYFNFGNEQPHLFKNRIIKKLKLQHHIDDDLDLITFLAHENPDVTFYWVYGKQFQKKSLPRNVRHIKDLEEFRRKYFTQP